MSGIATLGGVAKATVYNHFRTKDEVWAALLADEVDRAVDVTDSADDLPGALAALADHLAEHPARATLAEREPDVLAAAGRRGAGRRALPEPYDRGPHPARCPRRSRPRRPGAAHRGVLPARARERPGAASAGPAAWPAAFAPEDARVPEPLEPRSSAVERAACERAPGASRRGSGCRGAGRCARAGADRLRPVRGLGEPGPRQRSSGAVRWSRARTVAAATPAPRRATAPARRPTPARGRRHR